MLSVVLFIFVAVVLVALMFGGSWGKGARDQHVKSPPKYPR